MSPSRHLRGIARASLALAALAGTAVAGTPSGAGDSSPGIAWEKDFKKAQRRARAEGKPLMVDFWAEWCHWCHELEATTYRDARVVALAHGFVAVRIDTEANLRSAELAAHYGVETLPTIAFLTPSGRLYLRQTGFETAERFAATLEQAQAQAPP